ncbi:hypothetical protein FKM82_016824 [Ascaphus truei]
MHPFPRYVGSSAAGSSAEKAHAVTSSEPLASFLLLLLSAVQDGRLLRGRGGGDPSTLTGSVVEVILIRHTSAVIAVPVLESTACGKMENSCSVCGGHSKGLAMSMSLRTK